MKKQGKGPLVQRGLSAKLTGGLLQPLRPCGAPPLTQGRLGARLTRALLVIAILLSCVTPALAAEGNVTYTGDAGKIIFTPGSQYSPTDLFPELKDVMPGDSLTQKISVRNDASNQVKVKLYMRALGAQEGSEAFLSQLRLRVAVSDGNTMGYMFDAAASESAQLTDWVCLGTLYSGGEVELDVSLDVPVELDNEFQRQIGYLDWEFMIEEYEVDPGDPEAPQTGDDFNLSVLVILMTASLGALLLLSRRGDKTRS